ncbi:MAG: DUF1343 domain-containing protein [Opitutus sp.]|nr:DUF1343 domain-containing protein [Opitutus sp.]
MSDSSHLFFAKKILPLLVPVLGLLGCSASQPPAKKPATPLFVPPIAAPAIAPHDEKLPPVLLGIDVLEAAGFAAVKGKRLGLLTHPAGVNRRGVSTIEVLRHAPGVKLTALYAVEHGLYGDLPAEKPFADKIDPRTGLMVFSLYRGNLVRATAAQLKDIDALVIDLQDIGTRSYTFSGAMKVAMEACFENGKEVIILDRPNPLGGLKADGPPLDADRMSDVGRFRVPYVHGLTMGELALMVKDALPPGGLAISAVARARGKLTVIAMRGWTRAMRWPETGLTWVPTSGLLQDFAAVQGYPMTGLGCILGGFRHGVKQSVGSQYAFRSLTHLTVKRDVWEKEIRALRLPGIQFAPISVPSAKTGQPGTGLFIEINDYDAWQPTELSFWLMKLACKLEPKNPFATATDAQRRTFLVHLGSAAFHRDLVTKGKNIDLETWLRTWREQAKVYQEQSKKYWLYR